MSSIENLIIDHFHRITMIAMVSSLLFLLYLSCLVVYSVSQRHKRFWRARRINDDFYARSSSLACMTARQAFGIIDELQTLEFPAAFNRARSMALLKTGGIPTITKLLMATGESSKRKAPKRAVDTSVLLIEMQTHDFEDDRYLRAVTRMNHLHSRYRKAGKIQDTDLLHTLGSGMSEIVRCVNEYEWRQLSDVEVCALGTWHKILGQDMKIPFDPLPSAGTGWVDGKHFATELAAWVQQYEANVARNTSSNSLFVDRYVDAKIAKLPQVCKPIIKRVLGTEIDSTMRTSMGLDPAGPVLSSFVQVIHWLRRFHLRYCSTPRQTTRKVRHLQPSPDPLTGLYNFRHTFVEPWYIKAGRLRQTDPDRYRGEGYDLASIGPASQEGKGLSEMEADKQAILSTDRLSCPFSHGMSFPGVEV